MFGFSAPPKSGMSLDFSCARLGITHSCRAHHWILITTLGASPILQMEKLRHRRQNPGRGENAGWGPGSLPRPRDRAACSMACPELMLPSDKNDSLSTGAGVSGTGPGVGGGRKTGKESAPCAQGADSAQGTVAVKKHQGTSAWLSRCGHLQKLQHGGFLAASLREPDVPDMLCWHVCTDHLRPGFWEDSTLGCCPEQLISGSLAAWVPFQRNQDCPPCHTGARDLPSGQL